MTTWPYDNPYFDLLADDSRKCTEYDRRRLGELRDEYGELIRRGGPGQLSLHDVLSPAGLRLDEQCAAIAPHPEMGAVVTEAEQWMRENGMWLTTTPHIITAPSWMMPTARSRPLLLITKLLSADWYLNDTEGRDLTNSPKQGRSTAAAVTAVCADLDRPAGIENAQTRAIRALLREIRAETPPDWFGCFLDRLRDHIGLTHRDLGLTTQGVVPSVFGYLQQRNRTAGMVYSTSLLEYGLGSYLTDLYHGQENLVSALDRLLFLTAVIPASGNDVVSFEKEIVDLGASTSLIAVLALNRPGSSLRDAILASGYLIADLIQEFATLSRYVERVAHDSDRAEPLLTFLSGLDTLMKSQWTFHTNSLRYRYPKSIWREMAVVGHNSARHAAAST